MSRSTNEPKVCGTAARLARVLRVAGLPAAAVLSAACLLLAAAAPDLPRIPDTSGSPAVPPPRLRATQPPLGLSDRESESTLPAAKPRMSLPPLGASDRVGEPSLPPPKPRTTLSPVNASGRMGVSPSLRPQADVEIGGNSLLVRNCMVTLIEDTEVPAREQGQLLEIIVKEGDQVAKGQVLAQVDDEQAKMEREVAKNELESAKAEASNNVSVRYAEAARNVASQQVKQADVANSKVPGTVPLAEYMELKLKERQYELQIEQASHELRLASLTANVKQAKLDQVSVMVEHLQIKAPIDGIVVKRFRHVGEWVRPGDPVMRLVRADLLRVEAYVPATQVTPADVDGQPVTLSVAMPHGQAKAFTGRITFASPIVEAGPQFLVYADVKNEQDKTGHWLLRHGLTGEMNVTLKK